MATIEIEKLARENEHFRREVVTAEHLSGTVHRTEVDAADAAEGH